MENIGEPAQNGIYNKRPNMCSFDPNARYKLERLPPQVESLIYWRNVKKSGIVFGAGLAMFLTISYFSIISAVAFLSFVLLSGAFAFKLYKSILQVIKKTTNGHPSMEIDLTLSQEAIQNIAGTAVPYVNGLTAELKRLFLVEDLICSIKFGIFLWIMTYIGAWINGMTLLLLVFVISFTLPKVYENKREAIDTYLNLAKRKVINVVKKIKEAITMGNKKPEAAEEENAKEN